MNLPMLLAPKTAAGILLALLLCGALPAQAPLADAEEQRRRAQEEAEERQRLLEAPQVHLQEPEPPTEAEEGLALPEETPAFRIDRFLLDVPASLPAGHRALGEHQRPGGPFGFARQYLEQYAGRSIGPQGLKLIIRRLTRLILARGYTTTRLELPEQDLSTGTLTLTLIPGVIHSIRFADPALGGSWRSALPSRPGQLLNLRDLEQALEQFKRVPSQDVAMAILPGAKPGESEVVLTLRRARPWRASLNADNSGIPATGAWQGGLNLSWDNLLGWSDLLSAGVSHDLTAYRKKTGTRGQSLTYSVPFGYWTFSSTWSQNDYQQRVADTRQDLYASGIARNLELRVGYLFHRDQSQKNTLQFRTGHRVSRSFLNDTELEVQRRNNSFAELALIHTQALGRAQLDVIASHRQGVSWFGAQPDLKTGTAPAPTFYYRLQTLDATLALPLTIGAQRLHYAVTLRGQHTSNLLYGTEHFTIGSPWTVRGFDGDQTLAADRGAFLRQDLEGPLVRGASWYLGLDAGRIESTQARPLPGRSLAGMVLGLKGVFKRTVSFNLFVGGPLHRPSTFRSPWPVVGVSARFQL
jgi:hemolysin activation/secretion protein